MLALWEAVLQCFGIIVIPDVIFFTGVGVSVSVGASVSVGVVFVGAYVYNHEYISTYMRMSITSVHIHFKLSDQQIRRIYSL